MRYGTRITVIAVLFFIGPIVATQAGMLLLTGSPGYNATTGIGFRDGEVKYSSGSGVNNNGIAVGYAYEYLGSNKGTRAVRWNALGTPVVELDHLGTDSDGYTDAEAWAVNETGTTVGTAKKHVIDGQKGYRAVRWDASGTAAIELGHLGTDNNGYTDSWAHAVNNGGIAVGQAKKYVDGNFMGSLAVRWNALSTAAVELSLLGTDDAGFSDARAWNIDDAGTVVGYAEKYVGGSDKGNRAVRWDASGMVVELGHLGTDSDGYTGAEAFAVNYDGTAGGAAWKYVNGRKKGYRAVRWDVSGTAVELGNLGTSSSGGAYACAYAINDAGTVVGYAEKYVSGSNKHFRAVRWDASGTAVELGNLGTDSDGRTYSFAYAINDGGAAVGDARKHVGNTLLGTRAVLWPSDNASAVDLNELGVVPVSGEGTWTLTTAKAISADGWVAGEGTFDPDGIGTLESYTRLWVAQVGLGGRWTNAAGGVWGRGPNWSSGTPATQVGDATFDLTTDYTVALDRDELTKTIAVNAGTVALDLAGHTLATESGLTIAEDATLQASGTLDSDVVNAGTLAPGTSPATLALDGDLTNTGTLEFDLAGPASYDAINLTGHFTAGGTIAVALMEGYLPAAGQQFDLMDFGALANSGYAFDFTAAALSPGLEWDTSRFAAMGTIGVKAIPEPATWALLLATIVPVLVRRRSHRIAESSPGRSLTVAVR